MSNRHVEIGPVTIQAAFLLGPLEPSLSDGSQQQDRDAASAATALAMDGSQRSARETRRSSTFSLALVLSTLAHTGIAAALFAGGIVDTPGLGGRELDTISVEIVTSSTFESLFARAQPTAGGSTGPLETAPGPPPALEQPEVALVTPERKKKADEFEKDADAPPAPAVMPEPKKHEKKEDVEDDLPETPPPAPVVATPVGHGGATARATVEGADDGAAKARAGELARFAMEVRLALGRSRPHHSGRKGRVVVAFSLTEAGNLSVARVASSSGDHRLDALSLDAVRATRFPVPPAHASIQQRSYVVPFEFK